MRQCLPDTVYVRYLKYQGVDKWCVEETTAVKSIVKFPQAVLSPIIIVVKNVDTKNKKR